MLRAVDFVNQGALSSYKIIYTSRQSLYFELRKSARSGRQIAISRTRQTVNSSAAMPGGTEACTVPSLRLTGAPKKSRPNGRVTGVLCP